MLVATAFFFFFFLVHLRACWGTEPYVALHNIFIYCFLPFSRLLFFSPRFNSILPSLL